MEKRHRYSMTIFALTYFCIDVDNKRPNVNGKVWDEGGLQQVAAEFLAIWKDHKYRWIPRVIAMDIVMGTDGVGEVPKWRELQGRELLRLQSYLEKDEEYVRYQKKISELEAERVAVRLMEEAIGKEFPGGPGKLT